MNRARVEWTGATGLPGVSTFYFPDTLTDVSALVAFFNAIKALFPGGLTWAVPPGGDVIDEATGELEGGWTATGSGNVAATGGTVNYLAGAGMTVQWNTNSVINGRRVRGRTFLAPTIAGCFENDGTPTAANITTVTTAGNTLVTATGMYVWHRPTPGGSNGAAVGIANCQVPNRGTALRSRRY